jgi:hypothetical protein
MANKKNEDSATAAKNSAILPIDKKQVKDLKTRAKALVDTLTGLGNALKKATVAHEEFITLLPPHLEGITHALQSIEEAQHKKRKRAEKDPDAPKKPATSYFLFSNAIRGKVKEEHPEMDQQQLASLMGSKWKALTIDERKVWEDKAALAKEKYAEEDKAYKASKAPPAGKKVASDESSDEEDEDEEDDEEEESDEEEKPAAKKTRKETAANAKNTKAADKKATVKKEDKKSTPDKKKDVKGKEKPAPKKVDDKKKDKEKKGKK